MGQEGVAKRNKALLREASSPVRIRAATKIRYRRHWSWKDLGVVAVSLSAVVE